jgi:nickel/cobalt transporter (NicO) family protein
MPQEMVVLITTAMTIGFIHTLLGPDHYLPFIVMSKAGKWSLVKTVVITAVCGVGHVLSSVVLGTAGVALGIAVFKLEGIESFRGDLAGWALMAFGFAYFLWGLRRVLRNKPHKHWHVHSHKDEHSHEHTHYQEHAHLHPEKKAFNFTPWALFVIFVLGPCEPLIPILMYPAAKNSITGLFIVTAAFGIVTVATMLAVVLAGSLGLNLLPIKMNKLERYTHALAGGAVLLCGVAVVFLGL